MTATDTTSTRPYLIRALYEWCTDNGLTPHLAVTVDSSVQVPREFVKNNEIVLNIGFDATSSLTLGNEFIEFKARFGGVAREIQVPISHVMAIYARENGQGMAFPQEVSAGAGSETRQSSEAVSLPESPQAAADGKFMQLVPESPPEAATSEESDEPEPPPTPRPRPSLKSVK